MSLKSSENKSPATIASNRKTQAYILGAGAGVLFGLLAAYLFARSADEVAYQHGGETQQVSAGQMLTIAVALLGLMRQISELGKPPQPKK
ncbi:MAG: hypothetical protein H7X77_02530 [Anaerolineae bacterium]|nr:hypothetical protein [Anaerolineae bacterium]